MNRPASVNRRAVRRICVGVLACLARRLPVTLLVGVSRVEHLFADK
jgi:hypothetical protein